MVESKNDESFIWIKFKWVFYGFFIDTLEINKYDDNHYFNPDYPSDKNEVEWFDRFKEKGGLPIVVPRTFIFHYKFKS